MSLAWKVSVTVVLFARRRRRGRRPHRQPPGHPAHGRLHRRPGRPAGQRHPADGGHLRLGQPPRPGSRTWSVPRRAVGAHDAVPGARAHPDQRHHLPVRLGQPAAQPAARPGHRHLPGTSALLNGKPFQVINSNAGNGVGHTFSIPSLGINVPLYGNNGNANLCAAAPCTSKSPHNMISFSFTSPGPGNYRWQCFVPCGLGFLFGNGGPDVDARLHGRLHEGGGVSDTPATGTAEAPAETDRSERSGDEPHHWWRLIAIWVVLSAVLDPLFYFLAGPHIPPGTMTDVGQGAQFDFNVLFVIALPVMLAVWIYMVYAIVMWRASRGGPEPVGGPDARGHLGIQVGWILTTTVIVLFLSGFGTYELVQPGGAGGGAGLEPDLDPDLEDVLPIQVIGQQWKFTYRYPTFGGFETNQLVVPDDTTIEFNVTSLDVIHSFWAYQLGVKADANPDYNNVAYTTTAAARLVHRPLRRALRPLARRHVQLGAGRDPAAVRGLGQARPSSSCARTPSCCRRTR